VRLLSGQIGCQVVLAVIATSPIFVPVAAHAGWRSWLFGPQDYEECAESAAKDAKSKDALTVLLSLCETKFRGRRKPNGGYTFYDERQNQYFDIKGPNPTPAELEYIEREYSAYIAAEAEFERRQREYEREEAERQAAIRRTEVEAERRRVEAGRQAAIAQAERQRVAKAEFQQRQQAALRQIEVTSSSIECALSTTTCGIYKLTIRIRNGSQEKISALSFGWVFLPKDERTCPTSLPTRHRKLIELGPNRTTAVNLDGYDGPTDQFRYCVNVTGAEIVPSAPTKPPSSTTEPYDEDRSIDTRTYIPETFCPSGQTESPCR
jgi:hypothetical protein